MDIGRAHQAAMSPGEDSGWQNRGEGRPGQRREPLSCVQSSIISPLGYSIVSPPPAIGVMLPFIQKLALDSGLSRVFHSPGYGDWCSDKHVTHPKPISSRP